MSVVTIYQCDGCGAEARLPDDAVALEEGWRQIEIRRLGVGSVIRTAHVCPGCRIIGESARDGPG